MEDSARGSGLPAEMHGVRASDNGYQEVGGEEHERAPETGIVRGRILYRQRTACMKFYENTCAGWGFMVSYQIVIY